MHVIGLMLVSVALLLQGSNPTRVETTFDKNTNFANFRTYSWIPGYDAFNPDAHKIIVSAIEAEMTRLGFTKVTTGANVTLAYYTIAGTDVDSKALDKAQQAGSSATPTRTLGRLVVAMRSPAVGNTAGKQLWTASTREYVDPDIAKLPETVKGVTTRLFETYPGRSAARK